MTTTAGTALSLVLVIILCFGVSKAQFEDNRCKCVCPGKPVNVTVVTLPAVECTCEHVTKRSELECLRCECHYEERNTITIEIVVVFLIVFAGILVLYLIALLIMDPGMLKRGHADQRRTLHETDEVTSSSRTRKPSYIDRVGSAQKRWRRKVIQQRRDVFETHTLLS
ncbi:transmembrane protein 9B-like [Asterias amurensis]|uniref:transmembrane protein 9B-like n=1 Tax=Asterias amurensis TaxID=7602 RepID=UPI003AB5E9C3